MKKILFTLLFLSLNAILYATDLKASMEKDLYTAILEEKAFHIKKDWGDTLGAMKTPLAREALLSLFKEKHYWNRTAAALGLSYFTDDQVCNLLIRAFLDDHMIDETIEKGFHAQWEIYAPILMQTYAAEQDKKNRKKLLQVIGAHSDRQTRDFIVSVVKTGHFQDRDIALSLLAKSGGPENDTLIRQYIDDPVLRGRVLDYILKSGSPDDLPVFTAIIKNREDKNITKAFVAVNMWAPSELKESTFFHALASKDRKQMYAALLSFEKVTSNRLLEALCRISKDSKSQTFRRLACLKLLHFNSPVIIPYLESFTKERFIPEKRDGWDTFMNHITFGLTATFQYMSEKEKEKAFNKSREIIGYKLEWMKQQFQTPEG